MLKIRLTRRGKKKQPTYRVVVADVESKRDGRYVELIGWYNPLTDPSTYRIDEGRALYWLSVGAQPTDAVRRLLKAQGTLERLPRVHKGEAIEALVAEFEGRSLEDEAADEAAEETAEETADEAAEDVEKADGESAEEADEPDEVVAEAAEDDEDEADEETADEDAADEETADEDVTEENAADEDEADEDEADEDAADEDAADEDEETEETEETDEDEE